MDVRNVPSPVKRIVHLGTRSYGRLTAPARMTPSFLICGGQRCGTTSLYRALSAHPTVLKAVLHKGVHYFDTSYANGMRWYKGHFPLQRSAEKLTQKYGTPAQTFESSPYYMYHPQAAARIAHDLPEAKLIALVRDPVERAYSQHAHEVARGFEPERDFGSALALEPARLHRQEERLADDPAYYSFAHQHHAYRARGEYARYLAEMAKHVGRRRIHVVESERFFAEPERVYDEVLTFLGLPTDLRRPAFERHNARPRTNDMTPDIRKHLTAHFAPHDEALTPWLCHPHLAPQLTPTTPVDHEVSAPQNPASGQQPHDQRVGGARGVARGGLANVVGAGFAGGAGVFITWVVARGVGDAEFAGAFFAATAAFVLVGGVAKLGTQTGLVYWPARLRATDRSHLLGACLRTGLLPVGVLAGALATALWVFAPEVARLTAGQAGHVVAEHTAGLRMLAVFLPLAALTDALLTATRGYRAMRPTVVYDRILRSVLQMVAVGGVALAALWTSVGLQVYALAWVAPYVPVAVLSGLALRRIYLATKVGTRASRAVEREQVRRDFWRFTGPRALASVAQLALQRIDVLLVAALGGLTAAAIYAVAGRFVVLIQFANQGISQSVQPRLAESLATGDTANATNLYQIATGWLVLATWPINLILITFAPVYLGLFGDDYRTGASVVVVLACAMLVATGCGMVDMVLAMAGRTSWNLLNVLIALAVTVGLDLLLIPRYGALGAAIGLACAVTVNNLLPLAQVGRAVGLHPFGRGTLTAGALAVGCFGVLPTVSSLLTGAGAVGMGVALLAALPAYVAGAWLLRDRLALDSFTRLRRKPAHPQSIARRTG